MRIWVMRHGEAGFNATLDNQRTLTEKGKKMAFIQGQWLAKQLNNQEIIDKILVSPYLRTQQTCKQVLEGLQGGCSSHNFANLLQAVEIWEGITPAGRVENVLNYLDFLRTEGTKNTLIISHLPLVYDLTYALTHFQQHVHFYPAVIAEIDWAADDGKLLITRNP